MEYHANLHHNGCMKQIKRLLFILTLTYSLSPWSISAQTVTNFSSVVGRRFVSKTEYLYVKNDSILESSLIDAGRDMRYQTKADTLIIKDAYLLHGRHNSTKYIVDYYPYKIYKYNADSIVLKKASNRLGDGNIQDTLVLTNIEKLKKPINDFRYLKMNASNALSGYSLDVEIDSTGRVSYNKTFSDIFGNSKLPEKITCNLSKSAFTKFIDLLSSSLLTSLPEQRGCDIDAPQIWFEVLMNGKKFLTKGCRLYYPQGPLYNYLSSLNLNNGLDKDR